MLAGTARTMLALFGATALLLAAQFAAAQETHASDRYSQQAIRGALRYVQELEVQGQRIMTEALQIALQIEPEQSLERFRASHDFFEEALHTLRNGDPSIGLPAADEPELIAEIDALQQIWNQLDATLLRVLDSGTASRADIILLNEFDKALVEISRQVEEAYEHRFARTNLASIAVTTVVEAEHLSFLVERMQTELLLVSFGHDVGQQRRLLGQDARDFERTLDGLISGNASLRLMPPPNAEIRSQLRDVQRIWDEIAPTVERVGEGDAIDRPTVIQMVGLMEPLYEQMERAVSLY